MIMRLEKRERGAYVVGGKSDVYKSQGKEMAGFIYIKKPQSSGQGE
jgi:hypothetical protein